MQITISASVPGQGKQPLVVLNGCGPQRLKESRLKARKVPFPLLPAAGRMIQQWTTIPLFAMTKFTGTRFWSGFYKPSL
ncbi:MAG: hypothetical protein IPQ01_04290 [Zoogloea sp.]|nr:hypothetical protein [Zoogloea sp.]